MTNILQKYVSQQMKKSKRQVANALLEKEQRSVDFSFISNNQFKPIPLYFEDRRNRMMRVKESADLKFLKTINNKGVVDGKRLGDGNALLFSKVNPVVHLHPSMTPNSVQYNIGDLGKRLPVKVRGSNKFEIEASKVLSNERPQIGDQVNKLTDETNQSI